MERKAGSEPFITGDTSIAGNLLEFWQWSSSKLLGNTLRGQLAEYIVGMALGCVSGTRQEWNAYDLEWKVAEGKSIRIEAKSAAYFQSWQQKGHSAISFDIAKKIAWYADTNTYGKVPERAAAEYKHVVLGLIFLKYISDSFEEHHGKLVAGKGDYAGANT